MAVKRYNGTAWEVYAGGVQGTTGAQGVQGIQGTQGITGNAGTAIVTAKGDLIVATASGTVTNQAVGGNYQTLVADSTVTNGLRWGDDLQILTLMGASI